ncbi:MAG: transposase [Bacteroidales bacterium]
MASINENFRNGFENAVLVHDCWKSHFNTNALSHQICIAHLLRNLNYLTELYNHKWSKVCKMVFKSLLDLKFRMSDVDYYIPNPIRTTLKPVGLLDKLQVGQNHKELITFQKRLIRYRDYLFTFLIIPKCHRIIMPRKERYAI